MCPSRIARRAINLTVNGSDSYVLLVFCGRDVSLAALTLDAATMLNQAKIADSNEAVPLPQGGERQAIRQRPVSIRRTDSSNPSGSN